MSGQYERDTRGGAERKGGSSNRFTFPADPPNVNVTLRAVFLLWLAAISVCRPHCLSALSSKRGTRARARKRAEGAIHLFGPVTISLSFSCYFLLSRCVAFNYLLERRCLFVRVSSSSFDCGFVQGACGEHRSRGRGMGASWR